jgi:hypothetical protein
MFVKSSDKKSLRSVLNDRTRNKIESSAIAKRTMM